MMTQAELDDFYTKSGKSVVIDTNLFLLFLIGITDVNYIRQAKPTRHIFNENHYNTLIQILEPFDKFLLTPNILTEVNSFINKLDDYHKNMIFNVLSVLLSNDVSEEYFIIEEYVESEIVCKDRAFNYLGITDVAIMLIRDKAGVITKDNRLVGELTKRDLPVLNFNRLMNLS